ncbi:MAG: carboxymuconolactone decarboxylase family protein [Bosea sp. (in: a-proteobacteria)]|uniref:carboxymuconolactone decarboxylase family protein n=1 Tax=Bosea sp. (in: a-proteobacteria) TaxID=1871050 RepID=UPI003F7BABDA
MTKRLNYYAVAPEALKPLLALEESIKKSSLEHSLIELVKMRASQINGCAYCLHMHSADARKAGESEARLYLLNAWHESALYTPRERAALAWTEALTLLPQSHAPDADYEEAMRHFSEQEMVMLTLLIGTINTWNRIAVAFRSHHPNDRAPKAEAA